ncbi:MAG: hypothetical protein K2J77_12385 [Oscillospiraceae bacterium]|nr:hypothetical protein [Oscillospiraceae bacterium]
MEYNIISNSGEVSAEHCLKLGSGKHYIVQVDGRDYLRVEVDDDDWNPFNDGTVWRGYFCLGTGSEIIAIDLTTFEYKRYSVDWYFGSFLEYEEMLFAASAAGVLAFDKNMDLLWRNESLAVDGVTFGGVFGEVLEISCELDPPGGWVDKQLDIQTGREL